MKQLFPRGKRIRPTDKDLVFHTCLSMQSTPFITGKHRYQREYGILLPA